MNKRILCALLAVILLAALPMNALAARRSVRFGVRVGLVYAGASGTLRPALQGIRRSALKWKSSNPSVVSVDKGRVKALRVGTAAVAAWQGSAGDYVKIVVLPRTVTLAAGAALQLPRAGTETYQVTEESVAGISARGLLTGRSEGVTQLRIGCGSQLMTVVVTVTAAPSAAPAAQSKAAQLDCADTASQIVLVEYTGGSSATLSLHEKQNGLWKQLYSCGAYVGRNGIGKTKEGDKKTPVGTYNLTTPFGILDDPGAQMPYTKVTKYHYWCGASNSGYYNQLVDERQASRKHTSSDEYLINYKGVYNYCLFIDYNAAGVAHKGSCIFLHCMGKNKYTAGCVAVPESVMKNIVRWARPGIKIVIR